MFEETLLKDAAAIIGLLLVLLFVVLISRFVLHTPGL
jgi:hypothetical protein